jgi:hypothetical protein
MLVLISGIVVAVYTLLSAAALWLSARVRRMVKAGQEATAVLPDMKPHQVAMLADYSAGWRGRVWELSLILMMACLLAMLSGAEAEAAAAWFLALGLLADTLLFLGWQGRDAWIAKASPLERLADAGQCLALLAALAVLTWRVINDTALA